MAMNPSSVASIEASFSYRIDGDEVFIATVSGNLEVLLGFDANAFLAGTVDLRALIHADDADIAAEVFAPQATVMRQTTNLRLRQAKGRIRCVKCSYDKSEAAAGVKLDLLLEDAKSLPRTLSDAALTANFRAMMENTSDFIFFKDRNHVITGASQTLAAICEPAAEHWTDLLGQTDYDIFPEQHADAFYRLERQVFAGAEVAHEVQEYRTKDGQQGWVDNRKFPIRDDSGEIIGLYGIAREVTEQRRMQAAMLSVADFVAQYHGAQLFDAIAEFAAHQFNVDYVHIAFLEPNQTEARVVAARLDGERLEPGYVYALSGTPCGNVMAHSRHCCYPMRVQQRFPTDHDLVNLNAEGYIGEPILDKAGQLLGLIVLVSRRPLAGSEEIVSGLRILAARAAADRTLMLKELALRQQRETLQLILDYAPIGIWLQDGTGKLSVVNKAFCSAMGIPEERFLAVPHYAELIPEAFRAQCMASDAKALSSTGICDNHQRLPFVDGKVHDLRVIKAVKRDALGAPEFLVGLSFDITEELQREQALKASEQRFRTLFESTPSIAVQGYDAERRVIFWNRASEVLYGYSSEEAMGRKLEDLIIPDEMRQDVIDAHTEWLAGGPDIPASELVLRDKEGAAVPVFSSHAMQQGASGAEMYCIDIDLSEQKRVERRLALAIEATKVMIWELDFATGKLAYDSGAMAALGLDAADGPVTLADWLAWVHADERAPFTAMVEQAVRPEDTRGFDLEYRFSDNAGGYHWLQSVGRVVQRDAVGRPLLGVGYTVNIDKRKRAEEALRLAANVFTHAREGIIITDLDANILDVNAAFTDITGFSREEVLGKNPRILRSGKQDKSFYVTMWNDLLTKGHWYGEIWNRHKDGRVAVETLTITAVRDERGTPENYIALFSDITTLKEHQAQLEFIAHYDALTGLPNRLLLGDRLRHAMSQAPRRGQRLAVVYLDLDGFKAVNDSHGHEVGDQLLAALAKRMTHVLRDGDTLGRLGGDEFAAVLVDLSDIDASQPILSRLLEAAAQPFPVGDILLNVSASLGVTFYPQSEPVDADQLLRQADQAMYQAKQAGKNRYHAFDTEQDRHVRGRHESLEHIRQALAERQFVLFYQPKVNMRTGEIIGAEALIRWLHPQRGLLPPSVFLPVVENQPLGIDLGEWVIDTALTQIEAWRGAGLTIPVSVNVGALQLQHTDFVSRLRTLLSRHPGVRPGELELEVLETSALEDFAGVTQVMTACQALGVGFALDDFGTGYSSLTYLKQLPAGLLKIDQSFVRDMIEDPDDLAILEGVLGLATAFRRQVIAEGVETLEQGEMLLRLGCEWAQGYAIARPMPAHEFEAWASVWDAPPSWKVIQPISKDRLQVLFAAVEHRAWVSAMVQYLSGKHDTPPEQDVNHCRFGQWLNHGGRALLQSDEETHPVDALHRDVHSLADELMALKRAGRVDELQARLVELHRLRDRLLEQLTGMFHQ